MKHGLQITFMLIALFLITQLIGLVTINKYINVEATAEGLVIEHANTVLGEPPKVEHKSSSFIYIVLGVLIGTGLLFLLIRFKIHKAWKYWFLLAVIVTMAVSFGVYINKSIAFAIALVLGWLKIFRPNVYVHNLTEIFVYTGIAIIFLPILNLFSAFILLALISIYDMIAVWKSKHMVKLAKFQTKSKIFAGLLIPYGKPKGKLVKPTKKIKQKVVKVKNAILGGGDIAFPLLFSATAMEYLILAKNVIKTQALLFSGIIAITTTIALALLLLLAKEDRFYPAMPFISLGCFAGFGIIWLLV